YTYKQNNQYELAVENYQKSLGIRTRNLPQNHPDIIVSIQNLAETLRALGKEDAAVKLQSLILDIIQQQQQQQQQPEQANTDRTLIDNDHSPHSSIASAKPNQ